MKTVEISSEAGLQELLTENNAYANGKNVPVIDLYATAAQSRFEIENIYGVYLTRPEFAWMAAWIAVTDRAKLRKRHLRYHAPRGVDRIGTLTIGGLADRLGARDLLCDRAFLYLFDPSVLPARVTDIAPEASEEERLSFLSAGGYAWQEIERRGQVRRAFMPPVSEPPTIVGLDAWQVVVVQVPRVVPSVEIVLSGEVMDGLAARVAFQDEMPNRDYLET